MSNETFSATCLNNAISDNNGGLNDIIHFININGKAGDEYTILIKANIDLGKKAKNPGPCAIRPICTESNITIDASSKYSIDGGNSTLKDNSNEPSRGFVVLGGNVTFQNLTIKNTSSLTAKSSSNPTNMAAGSAILICNFYDINVPKAPKGNINNNIYKYGNGNPITSATQVTFSNLTFENCFSIPAADFNGNGGHQGGTYGSEGGSGGSGFGGFGGGGGGGGAYMQGNWGGDGGGGGYGGYLGKREKVPTNTNPNNGGYGGYTLFCGKSPGGAPSSYGANGGNGDVFSGGGGGAAPGSSGWGGPGHGGDGGFAAGGGGGGSNGSCIPGGQGGFGAGGGAGGDVGYGGLGGYGSGQSYPIFKYDDGTFKPTVSFGGSSHNGRSCGEGAGFGGALFIMSGSLLYTNGKLIYKNCIASTAGDNVFLQGNGDLSNADEFKGEPLTKICDETSAVNKTSQVTTGITLDEPEFGIDGLPRTGGYGNWELDPFLKNN